MLPVYGDFLKSSLTMYAVLHIALNTGHVFATLFPAFSDPKLRKKLGSKFWLGPTLFVGGFGLLHILSFEVFKTTLALYAIFHIFTQHMTWLSALQKKETLSTRQINFEKFLFLALVLIPLVSWSSGKVIPVPSYYFANDINLNSAHFDLSFLLAPLTAVFIGYLALLLFSHRSRLSEAPWGKLVLFTTLYAWTVGGLLILKSTSFFFVYLTATHAISYYVYIARGWNAGSEKQMGRKAVFFLLLIAPGLGLLWIDLWSHISVALAIPGTFLFFHWLPVLIHYGFDSVLWRRPRRPITATT